MARRVAAALALLLLSAACGGAGDQPSPGVGATATTARSGDGETSTTALGQGAKPPASGGGAPQTTGRNGTRPTSGQPDTSSRPLIDAAAEGRVGGFAGVLLAPGTAERLVLDVRIGPGVTPSGEAINAAASALRRFSGKTVDVVGPTSLKGAGGDVHTAEEIRALATNQGAPNRDGVAVIHFLYLPGSFENEGSLGVAVRGDTVAIFPDALDQAASPFASRARIERAVVAHELGHVLGLVDLFLDRNRDDPEHPGHSSNRGSVMFWAVETSLVGQVLGGPPPVDFDGDDIADLEKIRSGAARA